MRPHDKPKVRKRVPQHGAKRVHADRKLRQQRGYVKHKGAQYDN